MDHWLYASSLQDEDEEIVGLKLPKARQFKKINFKEDYINIRHLNQLVKKSVIAGRHHSRKRYSVNAELYVNREPYIIPVHNELDRILSRHPFPFLHSTT